MSIPVRNIFYLLSYAWNKLDEAHQVEVNIDDYDDSINLFARVLISGINRLFKKGLDREYVEVTEDYLGIKGKINFKNSINKQLFRHGKANCTFDNFSRNVLHNQILKSTLCLLLRIDDLDTSLRDEVRLCYFRFTDVDEISLNLADFRKIRLHRNNFDYDFLLRISQLIVENIVLSEHDGKYHFKDFIRNEKAMASLFENFIRNFYKREQTGYAVRREDISWDAYPIEGSNMSLLPKMQTDITLESANHKMIIDAKYYQNAFATYYDAEKLHSNNLYQIFSYLKNLESNLRNPNNYSCDGMLIYPTVHKEINEIYQLGNHKLRVATIDLSRKWEDISTRLLHLLEVNVN